MKKFFIKSIVLIAMMAVGAVALAQEVTETSGGNELGSSAPSLYPCYIDVSITDKGTDCPPSGEVTGKWRWRKINDNYYYWFYGTPATYNHVPVTVTLCSLSYGNHYYDVNLVEVVVIPSGNVGGANLAMVNKPFNPIVLNPLPCNGGGGGGGDYWDIVSDHDNGVD